MLEYTLSDQTEMPEAGGFSVKIIGIGGAGANVLDRMALEGAEDTDLLTLNTDVRALSTSVSNNKVQLGRDLLKGMGAGGDPELGRLAALEVEEEIRSAVRGHSMIFVCVGLGGGTGSGAAPEVCRIAKEEGVFLVVFATLPFEFEGKRRMEQAQDALKRIGQQANAVVAFENDLMGSLIVPKDGIQSAFATADKTISQSVRATIDIVTQPGIIRIGMDELLSALRGRDSRCLFGHGQAKGDNRAQEAVAQALKSPLLDKGKLLEETRNVLVHVAGGESMTLFEVDLLMKEITKHVSDQTQLLFGVGTDEKLGGSLAVTIISSRSAGGGGGQPPGGDGKRKAEAAAKPESEALETASSELGAAPVTAGGAASLEEPAEIALDDFSGAALVPTEPVVGLEPTEPVQGLEPTEPVEGLAQTEPVAPGEGFEPPPREPGQVMVPAPGVRPPVAAPSSREGDMPSPGDADGEAAWDAGGEAPGLDQGEVEEEDEDRNFAPNYPTPAVEDVAPPDLPDEGAEAEGDDGLESGEDFDAEGEWEDEEDEAFAATQDLEAQGPVPGGDAEVPPLELAGEMVVPQESANDDIDILASHGHGTIGALLRQQGGGEEVIEDEASTDEAEDDASSETEAAAAPAFDSPFELVEEDEEDALQGEVEPEAEDLGQDAPALAPPLPEADPGADDVTAEGEVSEQAQPRWVDEILGSAVPESAGQPEEPEVIEADSDAEPEPELASEPEPELEPEEELDAIELGEADEEAVEVALDGDLEIEEEVPVEVPESIESEPDFAEDEAFVSDDADGGFEVSPEDLDDLAGGEGEDAATAVEPALEVIDHDELIVPESAEEPSSGVPTISIKDLARRQQAEELGSMEAVDAGEGAAAEDDSEEAPEFAEAAEAAETEPDWDTDAEVAAPDEEVPADAPVAEAEFEEASAAALDDQAFTDADHSDSEAPSESEPVLEPDAAPEPDVASEPEPEPEPAAPILPPGEGEMVVAATETSQPIALFRVSSDTPDSDGGAGGATLSPAAQAGENGAAAGATGPIAPMLMPSDKPAPAGATGDQGMLRLEPASQGRFAKTEPTIVDGQDLDVPTYLRRRQGSGSES